MEEKTKSDIVSIFTKCFLPSFVGALVIFGYFTAMFVLSPAVFDITGIFFYIHLLFIQFEAYSIVYNYYLCITLDPGFVPKEWQLKLSKEEVEAITQLEKKSNGHERLCEKCGTIKPPRAHHSRSQNKCVMRMDHFCVWINNCVGAFNHKFFFLFLFYFSFVSVHWDLLVIKMLWNYYWDVYRVNLFFLIITTVFTLFTIPLAIIVYLFTGFHFYLIYTNQTSVEYSKNGLLKIKLERAGKRGVFKRIYDTSPMENLKQVLGNNPYHWFLPIQNEMDGIHYKTIDPNEVSKIHSMIEDTQQLKNVVYQGEIENKS